MANTYTITGATGNIGKRITENLLDAGHKVRAVARNVEKLQALVDKGAEAFSGSLEDTEFLTRAYQGSDVVFAMTPPDYQSIDFRAFQNNIAKSHVSAIKSAGVENVVALSSIGAHLSEGTGVVQGLYDFEQQLSNFQDVNVIVLRPAYFMENIYTQMDIIKNMGITGSPLAPDVSQPVVATKDIAAVAARRLSDLAIKGHSIEYILGQRDLSYTDITRALGNALGKEDLKYVQFPYEDDHKAMVDMGMTDNVAGLLVDLARSINDGIIFSHCERTAENTTETSIEEFAKEFAAAYAAI
jgi:uncharacterized protein YbjT (DUF2867 family)